MVGSGFRVQNLGFLRFSGCRALGLGPFDGDQELPLKELSVLLCRKCFPFNPQP